MTLMEHLEELRVRLMRSVLAIILGTVLGYFAAPPVIEMLLQPVKASGIIHQQSKPARLQVSDDGTVRLVDRAFLDYDPDAVEGGPRISRLELYFGDVETTQPIAFFETVQPSGVVYLRPMDPFLIRLKTALILGLIIALPFIVREVFLFVSPGLYPEEKRAVYPLMALAAVLFPVGAAFAYYMMKFALIFFSGFASEQAYIFNDIRAYLSLVLTTMLGFGVMFELPVVILLLTRLGIVSTESLAAKRKVVFVGIVIASAIVTPTADPVNLMALSLPLYLLFELSLVMGRTMGRTTSRRGKDSRGEGTE